MESILVTAGDRLDTIIYQHYKTLDQAVVDAVLAVNPHLLDRLELSAFDNVHLPELQLEAEKYLSKSKALW